MLILDTNVISEILRPEPDKSVVAWFESQPKSQVFTTAISYAEISYGVSLLPKGSRRQKLLATVEVIFEEDLANRILSFDAGCAAHFGDIAASRRVGGRPISQFDAMIAAIARLHGAKVVTRNTLDFDGCGIDLIDPFI
jgi:predicted nucleic acid-binding protein